MWVQNYGFRPEVDRLWNLESADTGMRKLIGKMARVKEGLKIWNKNTFGDVFANVKVAEEKAAAAQINFEREASPANRETLHRLTAEYSLCLQMEEDYWRQKAAVKWAADGEINTKFYQGWVKQRRIKNRIHEVKEGEVSMVEEGELKDSALRFFSTLLSSEGDQMDELEPGLLQDMSTSLDCAALMKVPDLLEVKEAVFASPADSTPGPDGFSALFFQFCWELVGSDLVETIGDFFMGGAMPRAFTSTMIILLPKKERPETWGDYRPISLCNVTNKVISKIITTRLAAILPSIISRNQSGFVKGRLLSDNVLLA